MMKITNNHIGGDMNTCGKCGHEWLPRVKDVKKCPRCGNYNWKEGKNNEQRHNSDNQKKVL